MAEPISLAQAKLHLRVDTSDEDDLISGMIVDAREWVEDYTGQSLVVAPRIEQIVAFNQDLRAWPVITVTEVAYTGANGEELTLDEEIFELRNVDRPARLGLKSGHMWPSRIGPVTVTVSAGYADATQVPGPLRRAMYVLLEGYYARDPKALADAIAAAKRSCGPKSRGWRL